MAPDGLVRRLALAVRPARIGRHKRQRARDGGLFVEHVHRLRRHVVRVEQLGRQLEHRPVLALEREQVVLARGHDRAGVGLGERAGVVGHHPEQAAVSGVQLLEGGLEVGHLVGLARDRDRVDAGPARRRDQRAGDGADQAVRHRRSSTRFCTSSWLSVGSAVTLPSSAATPKGSPTGASALRRHAARTARCSTARSPSSGTRQSASRAVVSARRRGRPSRRRMAGASVSESASLSERLRHPAMSPTSTARRIWASVQRPSLARGSDTPSRSSSGNRARSRPAILRTRLSLTHRLQ